MAVDWTSVHVYTIEWYLVVTIYMQLWVSVHINIVNRRHVREGGREGGGGGKREREREREGERERGVKVECSMWLAVCYKLKDCATVALTHLSSFIVHLCICAI